MPLTPGTKLGPYEIVSPLGAGGMGEVYRATDTNLGRQVALKVLPPAFANDAERMARFKREAQTLASLNHPNIATIHGIEGNAIVMELVEGKDLAGPLPLDEALPIARQIAEALEAAHEKQIVHRDLKPANIKITPQGVVKLLDFGLAKAAEPEQHDISNSPTMSLAMTSAGMILGTAAYMSPEQARGKQVDRRADIWAFGVVVLEMLTGQKTYTGDTIADTLAAVITKDPTLTDLPANTPPFLRTLIQRCLEKDPRRRLQWIGEARLAIETYIANPTAAAEAAPASQPSRPAWLAWAAAAAMAITAATFGILHFREITPLPPLVQFDILPPENTGFGSSFAVSPDGRKIAVVLDEGIDANGRYVAVRPLDSHEFKKLPNTNYAYTLFWSADSKSIGLDPYQRRITRHDLATGQSKLLFRPNFAGRAFSLASDGGLLTLSRNTGMMYAPPNAASLKHVSLKSAPEGSTIQYAALIGDGRMAAFTFSGAGLFTAPIDTGEAKLLDQRVDGQFQIVGDQILYIHDGALHALPFDAGRNATSGEPVLVMPQTYNFSASASGVLVTQTKPLTDATRPKLAILDRLSKSSSPAVELGGHQAISPDGQRIAYSKINPGGVGTNIWSYDIKRQTHERLTTSKSNEGTPVWSPDSKQVAYVSMGNSPSAYSIYKVAANGTGQPELIVQSESFIHHVAWSPDGAYLAWDGGAADHFDLSLFPLRVSDHKERPFLTNQFSKAQPEFSPDSQWLAYISDETGRYEVYLQSVTGKPGRLLVSKDGGIQPRFRKDGTELVYLAADGKLISVPIKFTASQPELGAPKELFQTALRGESTITHFSMLPDGRGFLLTTGLNKEELGPPQPLKVFINWKNLLNHTH